MVFLTLLMFVVGVAALAFGADLLVRGSARLALRLGVAPFVVGVTVVSFGTSSPEIAASVRAAAAGDGAFAIGNVVGSNIANIGLILGATCLVMPVVLDRRSVRRDVLVMLGITAGVSALLIDGRLGRLAGAALLLGLAGYIWYNLALRRGSVAASGEAEEVAEGVERAGAGGTAWDLGLIAVGALLLVGGAELLVRGASGLAESMGVPTHVIALTLVALGTSVPELAASLVAALRRHSDIAVGNILGSNAFNLLGVLGVSALVSPLDASASGVGVHLLVMLGMALLCLPVMGLGGRISRVEGAVLLGIYLVYAAALYLA